MDVSNGRLMSYLAEHGEILSRTYAEDRVTIHVRLARKYMGRLRGENAEIRYRTPGLDVGNESNGAATSRFAKPMDEVA
jgi:GTP-binding protein HflX